MTKTKSSTESTISTSLIQCIASVGKLWTSTYLALGSYLPASKGCWCREHVKMEIRNLQSLLVCSIILWRVSSTEDDRIFGWRSGLASQILILCSPSHSFPLWMNEAAPRLTNSIDSILDDKELMKMHVDLSKFFPMYHVCPKGLAALLCGSALNGSASLTWEFPLRLDFGILKLIWITHPNPRLVFVLQ